MTTSNGNNGRIRLKSRQKTVWRRYIIAASLLFIFLSFGTLIFLQFGVNKNAYAAVTLTTATGGTNISADKAANAISPQWTTLSNIVLTEASQSDFGTGINSTLALNTPTGWEFNTSASVTATAASGGNLTIVSVAISSSTVTITYSIINTNKSDALTISGIQIRSTDGACMPCGGNITPTVTPSGK